MEPRSIIQTPSSEAQLYAAGNGFGSFVREAMNVARRRGGTRGKRPITFVDLINSHVGH